ncbi:zinc finger protein 687b-like isoform X2 [Thalassophryne amazonica]|uniref:zinc finger protein 687b-like isoform X2 n=1 Tax=Thalassophryne amazonica TaxID=390379 RepID=UPI001470B23C|nr:zinc finger protein 687b-like isoform X2 [Thalassophryne amazonica]
MGDMKTPDFDDLLAAFDIPDIDAKEAIQSSPDEERDASATSANVSDGSPPSHFLDCSPAPLGNTPVVSVIVKNGVRPVEDPEGSVGNETRTDDPSNTGKDSQGLGKISEDFFPSQYVPSPLAESTLEPQMTNGDEESLAKSQGQSNRDPWLQRSQETFRLATEGESPPASLSLSPPTSPHSDSPHVPPRITPNEEMFITQKPTSFPVPQNGSTRPKIKHVVHSDEEDSEPDFGSPLVIQESQKSPMLSPPKFSHTASFQSELNGSPENTSCHLPPSSPSLVCSLLASPKPEPEPQEIKGSPSSPTAQPQTSLSSTVTVSTLVQEKDPDHVIEERDSPESPPPDETGFIGSKTSASFDSVSTAPPAVKINACYVKEKHRENECSLEDKVEDAEMFSDNKDKDCGETCVASDNSVPATGTETVSSEEPSLKVKIRMPARSVTKTVASKRGGKLHPKSGNHSKPSPEGCNTRPKKKILRSSQASRSSPVVAIVQDDSSSAQASKLRVSPAAANLTKTASVSLAKLSPGGINLHSLGQKTLSSAVTMPAPLPMLPQQSSSRPASIVNNTGAVISRSQTNLVDAFNKILNNKNLLPNYKPDLSSPLPQEWGLPLPPQGYCCLECGDAFALEQSLARHYDRRSLRIEVTCNHCAKRLAFFNKCSLLLHAREHKEKGLIMQCSRLVMKPVPVEQMIGQQEPVAVGLFSASLPSSTSASSSSALNQSATNSADKSTEAVQYLSNKCPECQVQFRNKEEVAEHFQEMNAAHSTSCTECFPPILLLNSCSAAAHHRIHKGSPPHVCPECGGVAKQPHFQAHLDHSCLHFARRIGYRCSSCLVVFAGLNSVKSHIQQAHCDMFNKCPGCPMAFKSVPSIQNHITTQHPTLSGGQAMLIYKCVMCDTVFTHKSMLYIHFDTHLANQKVNVFKCPRCTKLFSQRTSLMDHFKTHKTLTSKEELPPSPAASVQSHPPKKTETSDGEERRGHDEEGVKANRLLKTFHCNKCESSFTTTSSLRRHIRDKHKVFSRGFRCHLCTKGEKTFSSKVLLERHIQLRHNMDTVSEDTLKVRHTGRGMEEADSSSEQDGVSGGRRLRRAVKMEQEEESGDWLSPEKKSRRSSTPTPRSVPQAGYRCAPCGFTTEDHAAFLEHISQHRRDGTEGTSQQCLQCGACFTSSTSLSRHRFITHKVRAALPENQKAVSVSSVAPSGKDRSSDDGSCVDGIAPASPTLPQGKEEENALTCKVCSKQFDKPTDLNTHFRTHGMAFINSRNAAKNSS